MFNSVDEALQKIKDTLDSQECIIERLRDDNKSLKEENYKDVELQEMEKRLNKALEDYRRGFPISEKEYENLKEWQNNHIMTKHWDIKNNRPKSFGAIGGNFTYEFIPTSIGTLGTVKCSCGECFTFQEL